MFISHKLIVYTPDDVGLSEKDYVTGLIFIINGPGARFKKKRV